MPGRTRRLPSDGRLRRRQQRRSGGGLTDAALRMALRLALVLALVLAAWRTGGAQGQPARDPEPPAAAGEPPVIVALGDSLTAGFGLPEEQSYPALLQERLRQRGYPHRVVNAGVSGDTSAGALARMGWLLRQRVDLLIVCLGANDGLRGLATDQLRENLARIIEQGQAAGARVILAGMRMPLNYGPAYTRAFAAVYPALARRYGVALIPFLLEGVAAQPALNLPDGIHPNAQGQRIVLENVWRVLEPLLSEKAAVRR